jgi:hypothetical protein
LARAERPSRGFSSYFGSGFTLSARTWAPERWSCGNSRYSCSYGATRWCRSEAVI